MSSKTRRKSHAADAPKPRDRWRVANWIGTALVVLIVIGLFYGVLFKGVRRPGRGATGSRPSPVRLVHSGAS